MTVRIRQRPMELAKLLCRQQGNLLPMTQWQFNSTTTEEDQAQSSTPLPKQPPRRARSAPKTSTSVHQSSTSSTTRASERRPSRSGMQCLQLTAKSKGREPRSPEQGRAKSAMSSSRKAPRLRSATGQKGPSPSPVARVQSSHICRVLLQALMHNWMKKFVVMVMTARDFPFSASPVAAGSTRPGGDQRVRQLINAEAEMQRLHGKKS